jgi:hypothetical protein
VALGTETSQSGFASATGDKYVNDFSFSTETFQPYTGGEAAGVITTLPTGYPSVDFYGGPITTGTAAAAAGAVQSTVIDLRTALTGTVSITEGTLNTAQKEVTVAMWDSATDGWDGNAALRINVNGTNLATNARITGSTGTYTFTVNVGDVVQFYWVNGGQYDRECAFAVYYSDNPPNPAFNPATGSTVSSAVLVYQLYRASGSPAFGNGTLMGSFTYPTQTLTANTTNLGGDGTISYQWKRGDTASGPWTDIENATNSIYYRTLADTEKYITVTVTRSGNTGSVTGAAVSPVTP